MVFKMWGVIENVSVLCWGDMSEGKQIKISNNQIRISVLELKEIWKNYHKPKRKLLIPD